MLFFADPKIRFWINNASIKITSFDEWNPINDMIAGIHYPNGNPALFHKEIAEGDNIPTIWQIIHTSGGKMGSSNSA